MKTVEAGGDKARAYEQWQEFDRAVDAFVRDALYLNGMRHTIMQYADTDFDLPRDIAADVVQGVGELLDDIVHYSLPVLRQKLKTYARASGLKKKTKKAKA